MLITLRTDAELKLMLQNAEYLLPICAFGADVWRELTWQKRSAEKEIKRRANLKPIPKRTPKRKRTLKDGTKVTFIRLKPTGRPKYRNGGVSAR